MASLRHQYGVVVRHGFCTAPEMPADVRKNIDGQMDAILAQVKGQPGKREYFWLPHNDKGYLDEAAAGVKVNVTEEADLDAYLANLRADGWRPFEDVKAGEWRAQPGAWDLRDVWVDDKATRYARLRNPEPGSGLFRV